MTPDSASLFVYWTNQGVARLASGDRQSAIKGFLKARAVDPTSYVSYNNVGHIHHSNGDSLRGRLEYTRAAPYVLLKKGHVNVDLIPYYLSEKGKNILAVIAAILSLIFLVFLFYSSLQLFSHSWVKNIKTPTIWALPMWKVYIFLPLGMGILILQYLADIFSVIYKFETQEKK